MRTRTTFAALAVTAATVIANPVIASAAADDAAVQHWDVRAGWVDVPTPPLRAPTEAWTETVDVFDSNGDVIVIGLVTDDGLEVARIDSAGQELWSADVAGANTERWEAEVSGDGRIVIVEPTSEIGDARLLDAADGREIWRGFAGVIDAYVFGESVAMTHTSGAVGLDLASGEERWHWESDAYTELSLAGGELLVADMGTPDGGDGAIGTLDPQTGDTRWLAELGAIGPSVVHDTVLQADLTPDGGDLMIHALDLASGEPRFDASIEGFSSNGVIPGADGLAVLFGRNSADEPTAIAIDLDTGERAWSAPLPEGTGMGFYPDDELPVQTYLSGGATYVVTAGHSAVVLDAATGELVAREDGGGRTWSGGGIVYRRADDEVVALSIPDLTELWRIDWPVNSDPVTVNGGVLAVSFLVDRYTLTGYADESTEP